MVNPNVDKVLFNDEPGTIGRQLSEENLGARNKRGNSSDYVEEGLSFDYANNQLDISEGHVVISDDRGFAYDALPVARSDLALTDNDVTEVYCVINPGLGDHIEYQLITDGSTPSDAHLKVGEVDTSADTSTELNRAPDASFQSTTTDKQVLTGPLVHGSNYIGASPNKVAFRADDGRVSSYEKIYDELAPYGHTGTLALTTNYVDTNKTHWEDGTDFLDAEQVKEMHDSGWEMASHTHNHNPIPDMTDSEVNSEFQSSVDKISEWTGERPKGLICPYNQIEERGFEIARTYFDWVMADRTNPDTSQNWQWRNRFPDGASLPEGIYYDAYKEIELEARSYASSPYNCVGPMYHNEDRSKFQDIAQKAAEYDIRLTSISQLAPIGNVIDQPTRGMDLSDKWKTGGTQSSAITQSSTSYHGHDQTIQYSGAAADAYVEFDARFPCLESETLDMSYAVNTNTYNSGEIRFYLRFFDYLGSSLTAKYSAIQSADSGGWTRVTGSVAAPSGAEFFIPRIHFGAGSFDGTAHVSDPHVIRPPA